VAGGRSVSAVASALELSRPNLSARSNAVPRRRGRPPHPMRSLSPRSGPSSPTCPPMATVASTRCCAARLSRTAELRPTSSASTG
jgi:hypothetical protein